MTIEIVRSWELIDTAPKDGSPVWARGWDWGKSDSTRHYGWVFWGGDGGWFWAGEGDSTAEHLTDWMPAATPQIRTEAK
jgi:hypothetical protein